MIKKPTKPKKIEIVKENNKILKPTKNPKADHLQSLAELRNRLCELTLVAKLGSLV